MTLSQERKLIVMHRGITNNPLEVKRETAENGGLHTHLFWEKQLDIVKQQITN
jgi:hypothetical protein